MHSEKVLCGIVTACTSAFVAFEMQVIADSGGIIYSKIFAKVAIAIISYISVLILFRNKSVWPPSRWLIFLAVVGTFVYLSAISVYEAYFDYLSLKARDVFDSDVFFQNQIKFTLTRLLILVPLNSVVFVIIFASLRLALNFVYKKGSWLSST